MTVSLRRRFLGFVVGMVTQSIVAGYDISHNLDTLIDVAIAT